MTEPTPRSRRNSPPRRHRRRRAATAAPMPDRLSDLSDDLLHRILSFVPAREAASTAALSWRWHGLWPTPAAAVNLDTRSYDRARGDRDRGSCHRVCDIDRDAFFRDAEAALAAHAFVRRLAVHVEDDGPEAIQRFMSRTNRWNREDRYIADNVLSHPACRAVEDLSIEGISASLSSISTTARRRATFRKYDEARVADRHVGYYKLSLGSVPSEALRVLRISNCKDLTPPPPPAAAFPCLTALRLQRCAVSLYTLQDMVVASPQLATLQLEYVFLTTKACRPTPSPDDEDGNYGYNGGYGYNYNNEDRDDYDYGDDRVQSFCCPGITSLVLANCSSKRGIELDVPRVKSFRYRGLIHGFTLRSPLLDVQQADLHFLDDSYEETCESFWLFIKDLGNTKFLKLKLDFLMGDIAVANKKRHEELLGSDTLFSNLECLEVDGQYMPGSEDVAVAIGNLLQCCPVVRDLRLKLNTVDRNFRRRGHQSYWSVNLYKSTFLDRKSELDTRKSVDHFTRRRNLEVCLSGEGDDQCDEVSDIPGLSDKWFHFSCLRGYLRRVSLQFRNDKQSNTFGIQLVKFFARAKVLEEFYIDDGNRKMCEHMNRKVSGCGANLSQPSSEYHVSAGISQLFGTNQLNSAGIRGALPHTKDEAGRGNRWSTSFRILPLER